MRKSICVTTVVLLSLTQSALANKVKKLKLYALDGYAHAPVVKVYSTNGEKWNQIDKTYETTFRARLNAECKYEGKGNKAYSGDMTVKGFVQVGKEDPIAILIPHANETKAKFRFEGDSGFSAVQACNTELEKRLSQDADLTKYHILGKGFTLKYPAAYQLGYYLKCKPTGLGFTDTARKSVKVNAKINCMGSDLAKEKIPKPKPVPPKRAKLVELIKAIKFAPKVKHIVGKCPAQVEFNGSITSNRPGTVEYQYLSHDGRESPKLKLKFDKKGTKKLRVWKRTINKAKAKDAFAVAGNSESKFDYKGWYKLRILLPKGHKDIKKDYSLKCVKTNQTFKK